MRDRTVTIWILFTALLPLFLGADYERWVHGLVLCTMGAAFLIAPPRNSLARSFGLIVLALFTVSLAAFLPAAWFGNPEWRSIVVDELKISLPATQSPQPWLTLDSVLLFGAGLLWMYYLLCQAWRREERLFALRALGCALFAFAALSLAGFIIQWTPPLWQGQNYYGPIANRNQTALILSLAAILFVGLAYFEFESRHLWRAIAWGAGLPVVFAGLVINGSRAGILLFFAGLGAWVAATAIHKRSIGIAAAAGSILLFLAASFFLFGGNTLARFAVKESDVVSAVKEEVRFGIFSETLEIIGSAPVFGIGFSNFAPVYALSRDLENVSLLARVAQPDSDWLWLAAETGFAGLLLTITLLFLIARRAFPLSGKSRGDRRLASLRMAALVGVALFCVDGFVNVPCHRIAVVLPGILLLSLAVRGNRRPRPSRLLPVFYRIGAVAAIAAGIAWIAGGAFEFHLPGRSAIAYFENRASEAENAEKFEEAREFIDKAIQFEPLRYRHYSKRAVYSVNGGRSCEEALADFALARRLEPTHPVIPLGEAEFWLGLRPRYAPQALAEAMRRYPANAAGYFRQMVLRRDIDPLFKRGLAELAFQDPALQLVYLTGLPVPEFQAQLRGILEKDPDLADWSPGQRSRLFLMWFGSGDGENFARQMLARPEWQKSGWWALARHFAYRKEYARAFEIVALHLKPPTIPRLFDRRSIEELRTDFTMNESDLSAGLHLYYAESVQDNREAALATLEKVTRLPACPDYAFYLLFKESEEAGLLSEAWQTLMVYMGKRPPDFSAASGRP